MERYDRNIKTKGFTSRMQHTLQESRVLVVGAGGLGSSLLNYIVAAGVGEVGIVEFDTVSVTNLQRQVLYGEYDLGKKKCDCAKERLMGLNSSLVCRTFSELFTVEFGFEIAKGYDVIVDCCDNYATRYAIDEVSYRLGIPFVYGSAQQLGGQVATFNFNGSGRYCDLFPEVAQEQYGVGVLSPMPGIIGSIQALECIKILTSMDDNLAGKLLVFNGGDYKSEIYHFSAQ